MELEQTDDPAGPIDDLAEQSNVVARVRDAVATVVVGNSDALDQLFIALLCRGHALIEDVPGVGKTLLARSLSTALGCEFKRIQFTPDVMPTDITGSSVFNQQSAQFEFRPGPIFTQLLLADEINRATPRCQSALLEAMEEGQVTVDGHSRALDQPFLVLATQNPIELEGTFPLPEAQLDRFLLKVTLGYPSVADERIILRRFEHDSTSPLARVASPDEVIALQHLRSQMVVGDEVLGYLLDVVRATRTDERIGLGASPRAALALHRAVQARTLLHGRRFALPDDVKAMVAPVLSHRILLTPTARLRGETVLSVLEDLLHSILVPVEEEASVDA